MRGVVPERQSLVGLLKSFIFHFIFIIDPRLIFLSLLILFNEFKFKHDDEFRDIKVKPL